MYCFDENVLSHPGSSHLCLCFALASNKGQLSFSCLVKSALVVNGHPHLQKKRWTPLSILPYLMLRPPTVLGPLPDIKTL